MDDNQFVNLKCKEGNGNVFYNISFNSRSKSHIQINMWKEMIANFLIEDDTEVLISDVLSDAI